MTRKPHPGWACCEADPEDLRAWAARELETITQLRELAVLRHEAGDVADQLEMNLAAECATDAIAASTLAYRLRGHARRMHAMGNCAGQDYVMRAGHLGRVVAAHQGRMYPEGS